MGRNSHGCHDCAHARPHDILGHSCDLCSWIVFSDEHGNCKRWTGGTGNPSPDSTRTARGAGRTTT